MTDAAASAFTLELLTPPQRLVWLLREDLRKGAAPGDPEAVRDFLCWWYAHGLAEYPQSAAPPTEAQYAALTGPAYPGSAEAPPISHILRQIWYERPDIAAVYPLDTQLGRLGFVEWIIASGRAEIPIQNLWIDQGLRDWLLSPDPQREPAPHLAVGLWRGRADLQGAYDLGERQGCEGLWAWFWEYGVSEQELGWLVDELPDRQSYVPPAGIAGHAGKAIRPAIARDGVNLIGFATAEFGLGEDLRMAAKSFEAVGIPFSVFEIPAGAGVRRSDLSVSGWISDEMPYRTSILCMAGFQATDLYLRYGAAMFAERDVIGYWPWELPRWPAAWSAAFNLVREVWASSRYAQAAYKPVSPIPVLHMPMAVELPHADGQPRARFALRDGVFQFLQIFDWNSYVARKNPAAAIEAFRLAFPRGDEPVGLAIKMIGGEPWSRESAALRALAAADRRITLLGGTFDRAMLAALYKTCDAYVSLHRAEGFGRTLAEAMLAGKPVVATDWSGNTDFLDETCGCPVEFSLCPIAEGDYPYAEGQEWAEPDVRDATERLRWLAADRARAAALGSAARRRISEQYGFAAIGARYAERLHALWHGEPTVASAVAAAPQPHRRSKRAAASG